MAYESTSVPVERSQAEIRQLLARHGAQRFGFGEEQVDGTRWGIVSFAAGGRAVRLRVPYKAVEEGEVQARARRSRTRTADEIRFEAGEQEARRIWRVIAHNLKARMIAVKEGVETFEEAFLAHLVDDRTGRTFYESLRDEGYIELAEPLLQLEEGGDG